MSRMLFLNLPVDDVAASRGFFDRLGFSFDENFSDEKVVCMEVNDQSWVMLLNHSRFGDFAPRPIADARTETAHIVAVSAESRDEVDEINRLALSLGATPAEDEPDDYGFMYSRSFHDLDGHPWNIVWMDPAAVEQGPPGVEPTA
ncbi:MAG: glyoxalase [Solirubrobacterales bacterium]|nr:glyoxalase [Solirubrobacterales bacterium]